MTAHPDSRKSHPKPSAEHQPPAVPEDGQENDIDLQEELLPPTDVDDLLIDIEDAPVVEEPDDETLTLEAEDLENLVKEEPLEGLLDNPNLMMELSEDYPPLLKEIMIDCWTPTGSSGCLPDWKPCDASPSSAGATRLPSVALRNPAAFTKPCSMN
jgi:hypothetical protein